MLSYTAKDITTVCEKSNIACGMPIPTFTMEGVGYAGAPDHRAPQAKKQPMARCPLAGLVIVTAFVAYDTTPPLRSIFFRQEDGRCRAVCFRENPYRVTGSALSTGPWVRRLAQAASGAAHRVRPQEAHAVSISSAPSKLPPPQRPQGGPEASRRTGAMFSDA